MRWVLIVVGLLLLPPMFAVEGWPRYYLGAIAFTAATTASALQTLLQRR